MTDSNQSFGRCDICGSIYDRALYSVVDSNQGVEGEWQIVQCKSCKLGKLYPTPSADEVSSFYLDSFYTSDGKRFRPTMEKLREKLAALRGSRLRQMFPSGGALIDVGSGCGHFGNAMKSFGWSVVNFDPYSNAEGSSTSLNPQNSFEQYADNTFDVVTLWYVIEHLLDPRETIKQCFRILKPGGVILLSQQDFSSLQAKIFGPNWLILDPPRHIFQFSFENLSKLTQQEGFVEPSVSYASIEMGPFTILQSILNLMFGNNNDLFKFLKTPRLQKSNKSSGNQARFWPLLMSVLLLPILGPISLLLYFLLLAFGSGDIFTLYAKKPS